MKEGAEKQGTGPERQPRDLHQQEEAIATRLERAREQVVLPGSRRWSHLPEAGAGQVCVVEADAKKNIRSLQETQRMGERFCLLPSSHLPNSQQLPSSGHTQPSTF